MAWRPVPLLAARRRREVAGLLPPSAEEPRKARCWAACVQAR